MVTIRSRPFATSELVARGAGRRAAGAIRDGMQIVADHPDVGRPVDDMDPEYQEGLDQLFDPFVQA